MTFKFIDALKFFFCLCVVAIHCDSLAGVNPNLKYFVTQGVFRLAVPFFFVASGYFLGRKIHNGVEDIDRVYKRYVKRLLVPLVFFSLVNITLESIKMSSYMSGPFIFREIIRHVIFYPWGALWFVQACIVGSVLLYPFLIRNKIHIAIFVGILLYFWALVCNNYFFIVQGSVFEPYVHTFMNLCISARNGIFVGFVFLAVGAFIAQHSIRIPKGYFVMILVVYLLEILLLKDRASLDDSALYLSQLILVPAIFLKSQNMSISISDEVSHMLRNFSVGIYLLHRPVLSCLDIVGFEYAFRTVVVYSVCIGVCYLVRKSNGFAKKILF